jgi:hypothetical protein
VTYWLLRGSNPLRFEPYPKGQEFVWLDGVRWNCMRVKTRLNFGIDDLKVCREVVEPVGLEPVVPPTYNITVFRDEERYASLSGELKRRGIEFSEFPVQMVFSESEMNRAEFLKMNMAGYWGYPKPEDDYLKESYDTSNMCPHCGQGIIQIKPLLVGKPGRFGNRDIAALNWEFEWLVTDRLRNLIEGEDLTGAEFWPLLYFKDRTEIANLRQLIITNVLPPMSPNAEFEVVPERRERKCSHVPRIFSAHQMRYRREDISSFKDFNLTNEYLGGGWFRLKRCTVVSSSVYKMFRHNKVKRVTFDPVIVED